MESADFNKPRAFSMKQIRNLFYYHLSRSNVNTIILLSTNIIIMTIGLASTLSEFFKCSDEY